MSQILYIYSVKSIYARLFSVADLLPLVGDRTQNFRRTPDTGHRIPDTGPVRSLHHGRTPDSGHVRPAYIGRTPDTGHVRPSYCGRTPNAGHVRFLKICRTPDAGQSGIRHCPVSGRTVRPIRDIFSHLLQF